MIDPADHFGLVYKVIDSMGDDITVRDDLESDLMIALLRACRGFNPDLGWKFSSYAMPALYRARARTLERHRRRTGYCRPDTDRFGSLATNGRGADRTIGSDNLFSSDSRGFDTEHNRQRAEELESVCEYLTPLQHNIFGRVNGLLGYEYESAADIGEHLGISRFAVIERELDAYRIVYSALNDGEEAPNLNRAGGRARKTGRYVEMGCADARGVLFSRKLSRDFPLASEVMSEVNEYIDEQAGNMQPRYGYADPASLDRRHRVAVACRASGHKASDFGLQHNAYWKARDEISERGLWTAVDQLGQEVADLLGLRRVAERRTA